MAPAFLRLIRRRLVSALPSLVAVVVVTFLLTRALPGDPAAYFAGPAATPQAIEQVRKQLGLDRSLPVQFGAYVAALAHGDFGTSLTTGQKVGDDILSRLPASIELTLCGLILALVVAIPLGVAAATRPGSWIDHGARMISTAGVSLPVFFTGLLLVYVFYYLLGWAPAPLGRLDLFSTAPPTVTGLLLVDCLVAGDFETFRAAAAQLVLPAVTLGLFSVAPLARMTRASMLGILSSDFVRTARASGLSSYTIDRKSTRLNSSHRP